MENRNQEVGIVIAGRIAPYLSGVLPRDFPKRLERLHRQALREPIACRAATRSAPSLAANPSGATPVIPLDTAAAVQLRQAGRCPPATRQS